LAGIPLSIDKKDKLGIFNLFFHFQDDLRNHLEGILPASRAPAPYYLRVVVLRFASLGALDISLFGRVFRSTPIKKNSRRKISWVQMLEAKAAGVTWHLRHSPAPGLEPMAGRGYAPD
jgi:hypothetical protein